MDYQDKLDKAKVIKDRGYTVTVEGHEIEALFEDYDKDADGNCLSCCGDVLSEENGFRCETCKENC